MLVIIVGPNRVDFSCINQVNDLMNCENVVASDFYFEFSKLFDIMVEMKQYLVAFLVFDEMRQLGGCPC